MTWIERPLGVREVMGSNASGTQIFSRFHARVTLFSHIFTVRQFHHHSFIIIYHIFTAESCRKHVRTQLNDLLSMSSRSSVDRASARCSGGHGFKSYRDSDFF